MYMKINQQRKQRRYNAPDRKKSRSQNRLTHILSLSVPSTTYLITTPFQFNLFHFISSHLISSSADSNAAVRTSHQRRMPVAGRRVCVQSSASTAWLRIALCRRQDIQQRLATSCGY